MGCRAPHQRVRPLRRGRAQGRDLPRGQHGARALPFSAERLRGVGLRPGPPGAGGGPQGEREGDARLVLPHQRLAPSRCRLQPRLLGAPREVLPAADERVRRSRRRHGPALPAFRRGDAARGPRHARQAAVAAPRPDALLQGHTERDARARLRRRGLRSRRVRAAQRGHCRGDAADGLCRAPRGPRGRRGRLRLPATAHARAAR
mmetsp:Transcript_19949/g.67552  ORF Transcript_19949/g.67552 Transcript_19949/m.67552 type:complete len:204 (-) Transcript_19949:1391-2002(-)